MRLKAHRRVAFLDKTLSPAATADAKEAIAEMDAEWEKKAANVDYVPELHELANVCQFTSSVLPGLDEHWLCRHADCKIIVMPEDWQNNLEGGG
jgi:hypothetical protein